MACEVQIRLLLAGSFQVSLCAMRPSSIDRWSWQVGLSPNIRTIPQQHFFHALFGIIPMLNTPGKYLRNWRDLGDLEFRDEPENHGNRSMEQGSSTAENIGSSLLGRHQIGEKKCIGNAP